MDIERSWKTSHEMAGLVLAMFLGRHLSAISRVMKLAFFFAGVAEMREVTWKKGATHCFLTLKKSLKDKGQHKWGQQQWLPILAV